MATDYLKRVNDLIARTNSPAEEEARTSAFLACKLIREHGFQVINPKAAVAKKPRVHSSTGIEWVDEVFDDIFDQGVRVDPFVRRGSDRVVITNAKFPSKCVGCGKRIQMGAKIAYYPNRSPAEVYHGGKCSEKATKK